jgi:hypothetical protein
MGGGGKYFYFIDLRKWTWISKSGAHIMIFDI